MKEAVKKNIKHWWGVLFRIAFISTAGYVAYRLVDPPAIKDIPLAQLTLNEILSDLAGCGIVIGTFAWLLNPEDDPDPYAHWAEFGGGLVGLVALFIAWAILHAVLK